MDQYRIGVDVGGTFTDCVVTTANGVPLAAKAPTTPTDPSTGVVNSLIAAAAALGLPDVDALLSRCQTFVHGSTVATNVMVTRRGARTALFATRGHEDALRIGRGRQRVAGLPESRITHVTHHQKPRPLVQHSDIVGLRERVDSTGRVVQALDEKQAYRAISDLVAADIESLAVCLLWSVSNQAHEHRVREIVREVAPNLYVSLSCEVAPVLGEYERTTSTVVNAYVGPAVARYVTRLQEKLAASGLRHPVLFTQADGGLAGGDAVVNRPLSMLDSGPAAGVLGVASMSGTLSRPNVLCADVGGTTFDVGVVSDGAVEQDLYPVMDQYELRLPKVLIKSIGAGGGSIAWRDSRGVLKVGPQSAGALPGPACYGTGGMLPTVTDAYLVLRYLDPETPLASGIHPDLDASKMAISTLCNVGLPTVEEVAAAIVTIAENQMADLLHRVTMERGLDPREFTIAVYGGAGPLFGAAIAGIIGVDTVHVMPLPGAFSALGMLESDMTWTTEEPFLARLPIGDEVQADLESRFERLTSTVKSGLTNHESSSAVSIRRSVGVRFSLQAHSIDVELPADTTDLSAAIRSNFIDKYRRIYGSNSAYESAPVETVYARTVGTLSGNAVAPQVVGVAQSGVDDLPVRYRDIYLPRVGWTPARVLHDEEFRRGGELTGPLVVHGSGDTAAIPPGWSAKYETNGQLILRKAAI